MNKIEYIKERYSDYELLIADDFDDAIIGVSFDKISDYPRVVYSISKCIKILMENHGMTFEIAQEYFEFNVSDAFVGDKTPIWVDDDIIN